MNSVVAKPARCEYCQWRSAASGHQALGGPPQGRSGRCRTQRQDHNGGSPAPLSAYRGGIPLLAAGLRGPRLSWVARHPHPTIPLAASSPIAAEYPLDVMPLFIVGVVGLQRHLPGFARDRRAPRNPSTASAAPPASRSSGRSDIRMHFGPADQHIVKSRSPAR